MSTGCDAVLAPALTPRLAARFGDTRVIVGGFLPTVLAHGLFPPVGMDRPHLATFPTTRTSAGRGPCRRRVRRTISAGTAFAPAYGPLTIAATDGGAESEQGLAGGLPHTATRFGSAIGTRP